MRSVIDLSGRVVGKLNVIEFAGIRKRPSGQHGYYWRCRCDCGRVVEIDGCCLRRNQPQQSCGCIPARCKGGKPAHGLANHYIYTVWLGIKQRCCNPNSQCFKDYGGRGITLCDRWKSSVVDFYADMGDRPTPAHTIERIENSKGYEPGNCKWATRAEQNENTRQTRLLTLNGVTLSIGKWAKKLGVGRTLIRDRINRLGWSVERALTTPARPMVRS